VDKRDALIEAAVQDLVSYRLADEGVSVPEALNGLYQSVTFEKLSDPHTGLYLYSSAYLYELLRDELRQGCFNQNET
jgi:hypothetical protein